MSSTRCNYCKKRLGMFELVCRNCGTKIPKRINIAIALVIWCTVLAWFGILFWLVRHKL